MTVETIEPDILNKQSFKVLTSYQKPIMINKVGFFVPLQEIERQQKSEIHAGIIQGLEDMKAGRMIDSEDLKSELKTRLKEKLFK